MKFINSIIKILITILLIILIYLIKKEFYQNISNYYYYYFIILILLIYLFFALFSSEKVKVNLMLLFFSTLSSFYLLELAFFINTTFFKKKIFDTREKIEVVHDFKNKNLKLTLSVPPSQFLEKKGSFFPLAGISYQMTVLCNEVGQWVTYQSDRYGFNNRDLNWDNEEINYLLIGDSFVHGHCVNYEDTFNGNLEKKKLNVINLAYAGTGPLIHLAYLKEYAYKKKIKNIILFYYEENDLLDLNNELKSQILKKYYQKNFLQNLIDKQDLIDKKLSNIINLKYKNFNNFNHKFFKFIKLFHVRNIITNFFITKEEINLELFTKFNKLDKKKITERYEVIIKQFKEIASENNSSLTVIYLPSFTRYTDKNFNNDNLYFKNNIINLYKSNSINYLDIDNELFKKQKEPKKFFQNQTDNHYTPEAYRLISDLIIKKINDK